MSLPAELAALVGPWTGRNRLWFEPTAPAIESPTTLTVATAAQGRCLTLAYTWTYDNQPQAGFILFGLDGDLARGSFVDSFHTGDTLMALSGPAARFMAAGTYAAPPGPDWGWQITVAPASAAGVFTLTMHNVMPGGEPVLAVEATYTRAT